MTRTVSGAMARLIAVGGLGLGFAACGSDDTAAEDAVSCGSESIESAVASVLGENEIETFSVERLDECEWTSTSDSAQVITIRIEEVPDAELFVEHAIEATDPVRVELLDLADGAVLFTDEAGLGRSGDRIALITATIETDRLVPILDETLDVMGNNPAR